MRQGHPRPPAAHIPCVSFICHPSCKLTEWQHEGGNVIHLSSREERHSSKKQEVIKDEISVFSMKLLHLRLTYVHFMCWEKCNFNFIQGRSYLNGSFDV